MIADIFFINPCVEGLRIFDVLPAKAALAPRALAQAQMNALHAAENPLYLPFRMQVSIVHLPSTVFGDCLRLPPVAFQ